MKLTVRQVARLAGVSAATVSRVLNDSALVAPETRKKVLDAIKSCGLTAARMKQMKDCRGLAPIEALSSAKPFGCLIANPSQGLASDHFFVDVVGGAMRYFTSIGKQLILEATDGLYHGEDSLPAMVREGKVQGLIVGGIPMDDAYVMALLEGPIPVVFIGRYLEQQRTITAVVPDNVAGGEIAGEHLVACGYREFFYLGGSLRTNTFRDRLAGFKAALKRHGIILDDEHVLETSMDQEGGYAAMEEVLRRARSTDGIAVFAATDWMAGGVTRFANERGLHVPQQLGIVGYSDLELASHLFPPVTSIRVDRRALGYLAARTLTDMITGIIECPMQIYLQPSLVKRRSTR
ncbi:MAG: LacI family DNA-binding transcriptional regulator [Bacillota bacterium]